VAGNAVDIGYSDVISLSSAFAKRVPFVIIAPAALYESTAPTTGLVVAANSPIRTAKDLNGKVMAGSGLGTISGYGPRAWLEQNGADEPSVKFVELPFSSMQPALDAGRIDAATIAEPFLAQARKTDRVIALPYDSVAKEFYISVYSQRQRGQRITRSSSSASPVRSAKPHCGRMPIMQRAPRSC